MTGKILVTGGAGFIGSHLVDRLIENGNQVTVLDNLSIGKKENIQHHFKNPKFRFCQVDLLNDNIDDYFKDVDEVWHLAANSDVRTALKDTRVDIDQNILVTFNVLEAMRKNRVKNIFFTSTSTVYGEAKQIPTPENYAPLIPISLYGASKLACEALISAYSHTFDMRSVIFRLANIIGLRMTHGAIVDFINKIKRNPNELEILGNGNQKKSYLYIDDCIKAMLIGAWKTKQPMEVFNVGSEDWMAVKDIAEILREKLSLNTRFKFSGGDRGWKGDVPLMLLDTSKIKELGWGPKLDSKKAVELTITLLKDLK